MGQESIKNLKARIKKAESLKDDRRSLNESAYEMAMPQRNLYNSSNVGDSRMSGLFTSTGMSSANNFVNNMQNSLTPPFTRWAELEAGDSVPEESVNELNIALEKLTKQFFTFLDASNFSTSAPEMYYDLMVGTGALLINKGDHEKPLNFQAIPTAQLALEEGIFGSIGGVFRKHSVPVRLIEQQWKDAKIPAKLAIMIKDKPTDKVMLDEITYYDPKSANWYYEVLWLESGEKGDEERIVQRVTKYNPWIIVRWSKIAGEVEGRGPLLQALPDLKMHNHGKEMAAVTAQMNAFGTYTAEEDGILDTRTAQIAPGGMLIVKNNPGGPNAPSIAALPRVGDTGAQDFFFQGLEDSIKKIMMDNKLPPESGAVRSPTEIVERIREFQADFGAAFGRLMHEFVAPLFKTTLIVLDELALVTVPTVEVVNPLTGAKEKKKITETIAFTKIKMLSPVAKAQQMEDVQNVIQAIQISQGIEPRLALAGFKIEDLPRWLGDKLGVPSELLREKAEMPAAIQAYLKLIGAEQGAGQAPPPSSPMQ